MCGSVYIVVEHIQVQRYIKFHLWHNRVQTMMDIQSDKLIYTQTHRYSSGIDCFHQDNLDFVDRLN